MKSHTANRSGESESDMSGEFGSDMSSDFIDLFIDSQMRSKLSGKEGFLQFYRGVL